MNFKLAENGTTVYNGDIVTPIIPYFEFSPEINMEDRKKILANLNSGNEMLMAFRWLSEEGMNIFNVAEGIKRMSDIHRKFSYECYAASRSEK